MIGDVQLQLPVPTSSDQRVHRLDAQIPTALETCMVCVCVSVYSRIGSRGVPLSLSLRLFRVYGAGICNSSILCLVAV